VVDFPCAEADESDGSFLKFATFLSVVTNIEDDHLDHYGTVENIRKAFVEFLNHVYESLESAKIPFQVFLYSDTHQTAYSAFHIFYSPHDIQQNRIFADSRDS